MGEETVARRLSHRLLQSCGRWPFRHVRAAASQGQRREQTRRHLLVGHDRYGQWTERAAQAQAHDPAKEAKEQLHGKHT